MGNLNGNFEFAWAAVKCLFLTFLRKIESVVFSENASFIAIFVITEYLLKKPALNIQLIAMTKWRRLAVIPILIMFLAVFSPVVVYLGFSFNDGGKSIYLRIRCPLTEGD